MIQFILYTVSIYNFIVYFLNNFYQHTTKRSENYNLKNGTIFFLFLYFFHTLFSWISLSSLPFSVSMFRFPIFIFLFRFYCVLSFKKSIKRYLSYNSSRLSVGGWIGIGLERLLLPFLLILIMVFIHLFCAVPKCIFVSIKMSSIFSSSFIYLTPGSVFPAHSIEHLTTGHIIWHLKWLWFETIFLSDRCVYRLRFPIFVLFLH